nr:antitoxin [Brevundimonas sp. Leaf280]
MARPELSIFSDHDAEAEADISARRIVPHEDVVEWLKTWETAEEGPPPAKWNIAG